jgi:hypothetical protein
VTKQLLIYEKVEAITPGKHGDLSVKVGEDYNFAKDINSVPIMAAEFPNVGQECAIVFTGNEDTIMPVMLMGFQDGQNLQVDDKGQWSIRYVPAFFRRYPFVFSSSDDGKTFTLCIDEDFPGCNREGRGERLFDAEGERTQYLKNVLEFLQEYQLSYKRTEAFCTRLKEMDLLEPMTAQFTTMDGEPGNLTGFMAVNRDKIKKLSGEQLEQLAATDELELIYVHIQSLMNFSRMLEKMGGGDTSSEKTPVKSVRATPVEAKSKPATRKAPVSKKASSKKKTTKK